MATEESVPQEQEAPSGQGTSLPSAGDLANKYRGAKNAVNAGKQIYDTAKKARLAMQAAQAAMQAAQAAIAAAQAIAAAISAMVSTIATTVATVVTAAGGWIIFLVVIIIIILIVLLQTLNVSGTSTSANLELTSAGPASVQIGDKLDYSITVNYPGTAQEVIVTDQIPDGTKYLFSPLATYDPATNTVSWHIFDSKTTSSGSLINNLNTTLYLTLLVTKDQGYIINIPKGKIINTVLGEKDSFREVESRSGEQFSAHNPTPTVFQSTPAISEPSTPETNIISNCVITKIGNPSIAPSLPPECSNF